MSPVTGCFFAEPTNGSIASCHMLHPVRSKCGDHRSDDYERNETACRSHHQEWATSDVVKKEDRGKREERVCDPVHSCGEQGGGVRIQTELSEYYQRLAPLNSARAASSSTPVLHWNGLTRGRVIDDSAARHQCVSSTVKRPLTCTR